MRIRIIDMGFLKKIFGKKDKEIVDIEDEAEELPIVDNDLICSQCNMQIHPGQKVKTFAGKKMHMKPCWFKLRKMAKASM